MLCTRRSTHPLSPPTKMLVGWAKAAQAADFGGGSRMDGAVSGLSRTQLYLEAHTSSRAAMTLPRGSRFTGGGAPRFCQPKRISPMRDSRGSCPARVTDEEVASMDTFLANNRDELIARCKAKVAQRPSRGVTQEQLQNGIPLFLEQLRRTLVAEKAGEAGKSLSISGASGGDVKTLSEMGVSATAHGKQLMELGFSVDQVVHDYGDLCQAITDLAVDRDAPFSVDQFRTLNRCLDNAIADAVTEFSVQRDATIARRHSDEVNERVRLLVQELSNSVETATLAVNALETGNLPISGATGGVLKRSLASLKNLIDNTLEEVRIKA
jgi:hypothetical protein